MGGYSAADLTKQNLVRAAGELSAEKGIDNVSTRAIAERSGENIGSIHYHFGGKDGLMEAMATDCVGEGGYSIERDIVERLSANPTPDELSQAIRDLIVREIDDIFRSNRPDWHSPVIYQLLQRDDALYRIFERNVMEPNMHALSRFFRMINPALTDDEAFAHITAMKLPIFAHTTYRNAMLKNLGYDEYPETYLKTLEDILVKQTQLLFGLPLI